MATNLPKALYLREITFSLEFRGPVPIEHLLHIVRHNGSLFHVHLSPMSSWHVTAVQRHRMQAYLERNRYVDQWWINAPGAASQADDGQMLLLFGYVARALRPVEQMAPNSILAALLAFDADDCVGPYGGRGNSSTLSGNVRLM